MRLSGLVVLLLVVQKMKIKEVDEEGENIRGKR
jgi:hypothetical protein